MNNNIDITDIYKRVNLVSRYQKICENYKDFDNALLGNHSKQYTSIIEKFSYTPKYFKGEKFFRIEENICEIIFGIQLTLKNGMVEVIFYGKKNKKHFIPGGRLDFICEELEEILKEVFSIYEDLKKETLKEYSQ